MDCIRLNELLDDYLDGYLADSEHAEFEAHVSACDQCRERLGERRSFQTELKAALAAPELDDMTAARLLYAGISAGSATEGVRHTAKFWIGTGVGTALAASLVMGFVYFGFLSVSPDPSVPAQVADVIPGDQSAGATGSFQGFGQFTIAIGEIRDLSIAINSVYAVSDVQMTVSMQGEVQLAGFGNSREISWRTDLAKGSNRLTLPVLALGQQGGTLLVRIERGDRVDVLEIDLTVDALESRLLMEIEGPHTA